MVRLAAVLLDGLTILSTYAPRWVKLLIKLLGPVGRFLLYATVLPGYKAYLLIKKVATKFYAPHKSTHPLIHPFSRRYLIHVIVGIIITFTVAANLNAYEIQRDDFGETSIFAALVTTEDFGVIEEEGPLQNTKKITRYLGEVGVENQPYISGGTDAEELIPSTVAGDSAVVSPILSPTEENLRTRDEIIYYTVQPGDTVSEVAERFGVTSNTLLWENNLTAYNLIRPGDRLAILPTAGVRHKVAKGDTIASIAKKYSVDAEKIIEFNKLASADDINTGEQLLIPGGQKIAPPPTFTFRQLTTPAQTGTAPPLAVTATGELVWPTTCRRISQYFRYRHTGLDIACPLGSSVMAADAGRVVKAQSGWNGGYGTVIEIDHGNGKQTLYGHLSKLFVAVGEDVAQGQEIGAMGSTGRSTGSHVHFEVRSGGVRQNPLHYTR